MKEEYSMELDAFISNFAEQFDDTPEEIFTAKTEFKILPEWSSLTALTIIAMVDEEYGVSIVGDDIREAVTIQDLFEIVKSR